jgi:dihydropyrimidinase
VGRWSGTGLRCCEAAGAPARFRAVGGSGGCVVAEPNGRSDLVGRDISQYSSRQYLEQIVPYCGGSVFDLTVVGGTVATGASTVRADIGIRDGRVAVLAAPGSLTEDTAQRLDATSMYVVPGGIDAHVHFNLSVTEAMRAQSALDGSRAAAFGGTTTFIDFGLQSGDESPVNAIQGKLDELGAQQPHIDYALHLMLTGAVGSAAIDELPEVIAAGVPSFKMFTTFAGNSASGDLFSDDGRIWGVMERLQSAGGMVMVHAEDDCIIDYNVRRLYAEGQQDGRNIHLARPPLAEEAAIRRMILLAERSGCPLYVVHVSSASGVAAIREARRKRIPVYGEVLHNYLTFTSENYAADEGTLYHNYPPLKYPRDQEALWSAISSGDLDTVASDDFTIPKSAKLSGRVVDNVPGGHNGVETRMDVLFSEGVSKGRLSLEAFVRLTAEAPARLFGLFPRKGTIAVGSDADLAVINPDAKHTLRLEELHSDCDYSLWDGWSLEGKVHATVLRGSILTQDGKWLGPEHAGRFVAGASISQL